MRIPETGTAVTQAERAEEQGWGFPVISDFWPHGAIAQAYGVFNSDRGCANRATILIGADGTVVDTFATDSLGTPREPERYAALCRTSRDDFEERLNWDAWAERLAGIIRERFPALGGRLPR